MISMSNRQSYMSTVSAMLSLSDTSQKRRDLLLGFCHQLDRSGKKAKKLMRKKRREERGEKEEEGDGDDDDDDGEEEETDKKIKVPQTAQQLNQLMQRVNLDPGG